MAAKRVFFFGGGKAEGNGTMKDVLGGKGAGLAEMTNLGVPVPPGFTISTDACNLYYRNRGKLPRDVQAEIAVNLAKLERMFGKKLGDPKNPLLVSVRSGAKFSMPGMMDTVLNLGLNDRTVEGLALKSGNPRFAYDSYRRFLMMFSDVVLDLPKSNFERLFDAKKQERGAAYDVDLTAEDLMDVCGKFKALVKERLKREFPQDPLVQLELSRDAVFRSWNNDRAKYYRKTNGIPDDIGTAVNVQAMVFGNMGDDCATGVGFTRNPATGAKEFYGEYLINAQGEDVVAGIRTPHQILDMKKELPKVFDLLMRITAKLEKHYKDVQDFEFTIEGNVLYMLQTRNGKRTAAAAVKIALDMVKEKLLTKEEALLRLLLCEQLLLHHVHGNLDGRGGGPLPVSRLEHVQDVALDGEFEILHVLVMLLELRGDPHQLVEDLREFLLHVEDLVRGADAGDDVLALRIDEIFAVKLLRARRGIPREADAGRAIVPHVSEHHRLDVHRRADIVRNSVRLPVIFRPVVVPRPEHRVARQFQLDPRVLREFPLQALPDQRLELPAQVHQVLG